jgi:hypothetical protein
MPTTVPLSVPVSWAPNLGPACPPSWHADVCIPIEPANWPDIVQLRAPAAGADVEIVGVDVKVGVRESPLAPPARHNVAASARVMSNASMRIMSDRLRNSDESYRLTSARGNLTHRYAKPISIVRLGSYRIRSLPEGVQFTGQQPQTVASVTSLLGGRDLPDKCRSMACKSG